MLLRLVKNLFGARPDPVPEKATGPDVEHKVRAAYEALQSGKSEQAESLLNSLLSDNPDHIDALCLLAELCFDQERNTEAIELYLKALKLDRTIAVVYLNLARLYLRQRNRKQAAALMTEGQQLFGQNLEVANTAGLLWLELGRHTEAEASFRQALELEPNVPSVLCNLGIVFQQRGDQKQALSHFQQARAIEPELVEALHNCSLMLREMGKPQEALSLLERAIQLRPEFSLAHANLGVVRYALGEYAEALLSLDRAIEIDPNSAEIHLSKAHCLLALGHYREGWLEQEWRLSISDSPRERFPFPELHDLSLPGRAVLVYAEQGLGDEIMLASCIPDLVRENRQIILECDPRLESLFQRSFPEVIVCGKRNQKPENWLRDLPLIDWQIGSGSLPRLFRNAAADFPGHQGYLRADPVRAARWRERLDELGPGLKVGISWRGGTSRTDQGLRSIALQDWLPILETSGLHFIDLQYTNSQEERSALEMGTGISLWHWSHAIQDYGETAALVTALDLVLTVCTSLVHLTGALGKPAWVLVPNPPGWRYGCSGADMPWYPSVRLFRQQAPMIWHPVMQSIREALDAEISLATQ